MAVIFHWDAEDEHFVAMHNGIGEPMILLEASGHPVMIAKFHTLLPEWRRKEDLLQTEGLSLQDYFNHVEEVFASIPSPITGART